MKQSNYGAVSNTNEVDNIEQHHHDDNDTFDANTTYYLKDTNRWTFRKLISLTVPLLGAVLILGGAVWYLLSDFNHLYPGHESSSSSSSSYEKRQNGGSSTVSSTSSSNQISPKATPKESEITPSNKGKGMKIAACRNYEACSALIGDCCPTPEGKTLECCG